MKKLQRIKIGVLIVGLLLVLHPIQGDSSVVKDNVKSYLESKGSPLSEYTDVLLQQEDWKLLIAISRIESAWCTRKIDFNCWGIGGDSSYRHYKDYPEAIKHAQEVINYWQERGRWNTVEDMNCHYVVPCNQNWVLVVNSTLKELNIITKLN